MVSIVCSTNGVLLLLTSGTIVMLYVIGILQTPSPKFDEHITLREKNNRYVHHQIRFADAGGANIFPDRITKF